MPHVNQNKSRESRAADPISSQLITEREQDVLTISFEVNCKTQGHHILRFWMVMNLERILFSLLFSLSDSVGDTTQFMS